MHAVLLTLTLFLAGSSVASAQNRKYMPIPPAAAEVIAALPISGESLDEVIEHYVTAPLH